MDERSKGIRHGGGGAYLRCPVFTTVHFSLCNEGSSEYICVCEGRESLRPNFYFRFQDPEYIGAISNFYGNSRRYSQLCVESDFL